jgi:hypothetical protein
VQFYWDLLVGQSGIKTLFILFLPLVSAVSNIPPLLHFHSVTMTDGPPPKSNHRHPCHKGSKVLGRQTELWFTEAKCEVSWQRVHGTEVVIAMSQIISSGHWKAHRHMNNFHLYGTLQVVTVQFHRSCGTNMDNKKQTGKN